MSPVQRLGKVIIFELKASPRASEPSHFHSLEFGIKSTKSKTWGDVTIIRQVHKPCEATECHDFFVDFIGFLFCSYVLHLK